MVLPLVLYIVSTFFGHTIGCISVGSIGILGILFKDLVLNIIIKTYKIEKCQPFQHVLKQISYDKIRNITKTYSKETVLKIDYLDINSGQTFGLVGNNVSSKTTLI